VLESESGEDEVRPFRFGVQVAGTGSRDEWVARAYRAEALGYDTWTLADHFGARFAPIPALATAAEATVSLRIGSFVFANDYRHPVVLAQEAATLDVLSGGRFELGIGAGWLREEYAWAGIPFDPPGVRIDRLAEALTIIKGLLGEGPVNFAGAHYRITGMTGGPRPIQRPHPPILVGGGGPRLLTLAAREATIVGLNPRALPGGGLDRADIGFASVARKATLAREAAGLRWEDVELNIAAVEAAVTDDPRGAAAPIAARLGLGEEDVLTSPHVLLGTADALADRLREYRERWGLAYIIVPERAMAAFAPVVARLRGT
jgi:probable F420-dependent oxidoreductase